jgi:CRISPR-associated exonuclease Cas4
MTASMWMVSGICVFVSLLIAFIVRKRLLKARAIQAERASRPTELLDAQLIYMEKLFRVSRPVSLVAKLDRAYRTPSGVIVLVELKTRWINRPYLSDVIQLSAQRMALERRTRRPVAMHGYVVVKIPGKTAVQAAHRVELMSEEVVAALVRRREAILAKQVEPRYSGSRNVCRTCTFRSECDSPYLSEIQRD